MLHIDSFIVCCRLPASLEFTSLSLEHPDTHVFVVDEVAQWDRESLHSGLAPLTGFAINQGKQLIVILQSNRQLNDFKVSACFLHKKVCVVEINHARPEKFRHTPQ